MGLISTVNVFALVSVPVGLLVRGYNISWRTLIVIASLAIVLDLGKLLLCSFFQLRAFPALSEYVFVATTIVDLAVVFLVLQHQRLRKLIESTNKEAAVAGGFAVAFAVMNCVGPLYQTTSSPVFEEDVLMRAVRMNLRMMLLLAAGTIATRQSTKRAQTLNLSHVVLALAFAAPAASQLARIDGCGVCVELAALIVAGSLALITKDTSKQE